MSYTAFSGGYGCGSMCCSPTYSSSSASSALENKVYSMDTGSRGSGISYSMGSSTASSYSGSFGSGKVYNLDSKPAIVINYSSPESQSYSDPISESLKSYSNFTTAHESHPIFMPGIFTTGQRTKFVHATEDVKEIVEETFQSMTGRELPDFNINVCDEKTFFEHHARFGGHWSPGILGFCSHVTKEIFVKQAELAEVIMVLGHEIGHLMSAALPNAIDEEAKAMAFTAAWAETIRKNNIGELRNAVVMHQPANNGLHNVAHHFVNRMLDAGTKAIDVFEQLKRCYISNMFA
ncbi:hypothetical protein KY335_05030 [Candidatus Woesearchaeota archaeon]|nr:hypothetical protein [Candidatus Woesearchaeota archaeon]